MTAPRSQRRSDGRSGKWDQSEIRTHPKDDRKDRQRERQPHERSLRRCGAQCSQMCLSQEPQASSSRYPRTLTPKGAAKTQMVPWRLTRPHCSPVRIRLSSAAWSFPFWLRPSSSNFREVVRSALPRRRCATTTWRNALAKGSRRSSTSTSLKRPRGRPAATVRSEVGGRSSLASSVADASWPRRRPPSGGRSLPSGRWSLWGGCGMRASARSAPTGRHLLWPAAILLTRLIRRGGSAYSIGWNTKRPTPKPESSRLFACRPSPAGVGSSREPLVRRNGAG